MMCGPLAGDFYHILPIRCMYVVCDLFYIVLFSIFVTHVPVFVNKTHKYPKWFIREITSNIRLKEKLYRHYK